MDYDKKALRAWKRKMLRIAKRADYVGRLGFMSKQPKTPEAKEHVRRINLAIMDKLK